MKGCTDNLSLSALESSLCKTTTQVLWPLVKVACKQRFVARAFFLVIFGCCNLLGLDSIATNVSISFG